MAEQHLGSAYVTAASTIDLLVEKKALRETTGRKRNRIFRFTPSSISSSNSSRRRPTHRRHGRPTC